MNNNLNKNKQKIIILCAFILGFLITIYIKTFNTHLVYITLEEKKKLENQIDIVTKEIDKLKKIKKQYDKTLSEYKYAEINETSVKDLMNTELSYLKQITGKYETSGEGIIITIKDSEKELEENQNPNDLIVHDIDILRIINDLKKAGAKAISINEERLVSLSPIKCSGSTIKINGKTYGQPFVIKAIGDIEILKASVLSPQSYTSILNEIYGILIKVEEKKDITVNSFKKY